MADASASSSSAATPAISADTLAKLKEQIEYYFSDSNFRKDKFLRGKAAEDADGFVPLSVLLTFNRVKAQTSQVPDLAAALESSAELELSADKTAVRRIRPLPEDDDSENRSIYVKGPFPSTATLDQMQAFAKTLGNVKRVVMRRVRAPEKPFKGSLFIEFATEAEAKTVVENAAKGEVKFEDRAVEKCELMKVCRMICAENRRGADRGSSTSAPGWLPPSFDVVHASNSTLLSPSNYLQSYFERKRAESATRKSKKASEGGKSGAGAADKDYTKPGGKVGGGMSSQTASDDDGDATKRPFLVETGDRCWCLDLTLLVFLLVSLPLQVFEKTFVPGMIVKLSALGDGASIDTLAGYLQTLGDLKFVELDPTAKSGE